MGAAGCLVRGFWMLLGNALLVLLLVFIALEGGPLYSQVSLGFWIIVALVVLARYVDVTRYMGTTSSGDRPATLVDVKRFSTLQIVIAEVAWAAVHAL